MTISTVLNMNSEIITIKDVHGNDHPLTKLYVGVMIGVGWLCFLLSWLFNIAYYKFHPSSVEVFPLSDKKILYVLGKKRSWFGNNNQSNTIEGKN